MHGNNVMSSGSLPSWAKPSTLYGDKGLTSNRSYSGISLSYFVVYPSNRIISIFKNLSNTASENGDIIATMTYLTD